MPRICNIFEITRTIYSNREKLVQFVKQNGFLTCSWRFLRSDMYIRIIRVQIGKKKMGFRNLQNLMLMLKISRNG